MSTYRNHEPIRRSGDPFELQNTSIMGLFDDAPEQVREEARLLAAGKVAVDIEHLRAALGVVHLECGPIGEVDFVPAEFPMPLALLDASDAGEMFSFDGAPTPSGEPNALVVLRNGDFESVNMFVRRPPTEAMVIAHTLAVCAWTADELGLGDGA